MNKTPLASIIINNYNYERFLAEAIESALNQSYANIQVIVVDDGSTDNSRDIIAGYGNRITPVLKENGGMGSTYNAGFPASQGEVIYILDSDDTLFPTAVEKGMELFQDPNVAKVHWSLEVIDEQGEKIGRTIPGEILSEGDLQQALISDGPDGYTSPPTSGNAWSRKFLSQVLPLPENDFRQNADTYLYTLAPLFGIVRRILEPQSCYRVHGNNDYACKAADEKNRRNLEIYEYRCQLLSKHLKNMGIDIAPETWKKTNPRYIWMQWLNTATEKIKELIPAGQSLILVDEDQLWDRNGSSEIVANRQTLPFLERDGQYWGPPPDDDTAIRELNRMRHSGANFIVFAWTAFWWLEYYSAFHDYLRSKFRCVLKNDRLVVFDLSV